MGEIHRALSVIQLMYGPSGNIASWQQLEHPRLLSPVQECHRESGSHNQLPIPPDPFVESNGSAMTLSHQGLTINYSGSSGPENNLFLKDKSYFSARPIGSSLTPSFDTKDVS